MGRARGSHHLVASSPGRRDAFTAVFGAGSLATRGWEALARRHATQQLRFALHRHADPEFMDDPLDRAHAARKLITDPNLNRRTWQSVNLSADERSLIAAESRERQAQLNDLLDRELDRQVRPYVEMHETAASNLLTNSTASRPLTSIADMRRRIVPGVWVRHVMYLFDGTPAGEPQALEVDSVRGRDISLVDAHGRRTTARFPQRRDRARFQNGGVTVLRASAAGADGLVPDSELAILAEADRHGPALAGPAFAAAQQYLDELQTATWSSPWRNAAITEPLAAAFAELDEPASEPSAAVREKVRRHLRPLAVLTAVRDVRDALKAARDAHEPGERRNRYKRALTLIEPAVSAARADYDADLAQRQSNENARRR